MTLLLTLVAVPLLAGNPCLPHTAERIRTGDLARAIPQLAGLPADVELSYAPVPGAKRVFRAPEIQRIAKKYGIAIADPVEVCFEYPMQPLTREGAAEAMRKLPELAKAQVEVSDVSRFPAPVGELVFPLSGLTYPARGSSGSSLWKGYVLYYGTRKFRLWARVKLSAPVAQVVAARPLKAGDAITAADVRVEQKNGFPFGNVAAGSLEQVVGKRVQRSIAEGAPVAPSLLEDVPAVERGEIVEVEVKSGAAHLSFTGKAETDGKIGERIQVRNTESGRTFSAEVIAKGRVLVEAGAAPQK